MNAYRQLHEREPDPLDHDDPRPYMVVTTCIAEGVNGEFESAEDAWDELAPILYDRKGDREVAVLKRKDPVRHLHDDLKRPTGPAPTDVWTTVAVGDISRRWSDR